MFVHVCRVHNMQVECLELVHDDVVRVIDDMAEVHRLQQAGRGWEDDMALVSLMQACTCTTIEREGGKEGGRDISYC